MVLKRLGTPDLKPKCEPNGGQMTPVGDPCSRVNPTVPRVISFVMWNLQIFFLIILDSFSVCGIIQFDFILLFLFILLCCTLLAVSCVNCYKNKVFACFALNHMELHLSSSMQETVRILLLPDLEISSKVYLTRISLTVSSLTQHFLLVLHNQLFL